MALCPPASRGIKARPSGPQNPALSPPPFCPFQAPPTQLPRDRFACPEDAVRKAARTAHVFGAQDQARSRLLLSAAAQHPHKLLVRPENLAGSAARKVAAKLIRAGL